MTSQNNILISESTEAERNYIDDKIVEYNAGCVPFTQKTNPLPLNFIIRENKNGITVMNNKINEIKNNNFIMDNNNTKNKIIGGINACMYHWGITFIDILWVDEAFRGKGYGSLLLQKVEEKAKENGCTLIHLDSFDFQAKEFYLKQGYEIFGVLENCPPGHKRFYFKKDLKIAKRA